jgi:predicted RNA binding protein YcfA (HicA-like mRNA interferase family)
MSLQAAADRESGRKTLSVGGEMKKFFRGWFVVVLTVFVASPNLAYAFYLDGLMSCMSSGTVQKILEKNGFMEIRLQEDGSVVARHNQDESRTLTALFRNDRLVQLRYNFPPGLSQFIGLVEQKNKEFGRYSSVLLTPAGGKANSEAAAVSLGWVDKETEIEVRFAEFAGSQQLAVTHRVKNACQ